MAVKTSDTTSKNMTKLITPVESKKKGSYKFKTIMLESKTALQMANNSVANNKQ